VRSVSNDGNAFGLTASFDRGQVVWFAAKRRRLLHGTRSAPAAVDRCLLPAWRPAANPPHAAAAAVHRWDTESQANGRTDIRTLNRYIAAPRVIDVQRLQFIRIFV